MINSFTKFCKDNYDKALNKNRVEEILTSFLEQHDLEILLAAYDSSVLPKAKASVSELFLFNKFVEDIYSENENLFQILLNIVIGHVLASIILYGNEADNLYKSKLKNLNLYLDTELIFRLFGLEGKIVQSFYAEFLNQLNKQEVNLYIFQHTYNEIMGILQNAFQWAESPNYDPTKASLVLRYFKARGYKESDIQMFINSIDKFLDKYAIRKIEPPTSSEYDHYQIDVEKLKEIIISTYKNYAPNFELSEKEYTIWKDIQSISAVYKLRKGIKPLNIKQAKHIFVTTNAGLVYANKIFEKEKYKGNFYIPTCVTDTFIGTLIWLRDPQKAIEVNKKKIIAETYSALQPGEFLLKQYLVELEKLKEKREISQEDYILLRESQVAKIELAEQTLNDPNKFNLQTTTEILEKIKSEGYKKYKQEREEHMKTKIELEKEKKERKEMLMKAERKANIWAIIFSWILVLIAFIIYLFLQLLGYSSILKLIISVIFLVMGILGITVKKIKIFLRKIILIKIFGLENKQ